MRAFARGTGGAFDECFYRGPVILMPVRQTSILGPPAYRTLSRAERRQEARARRKNGNWAPGRRRSLRIGSKRLVSVPILAPIELRAQLYRTGDLEVVIYLRGGDTPEADDLKLIRAMLGFCGDREHAGWGLGPVCTEQPGHGGDHVAEDDLGREVSRWERDR